MVARRELAECDQNHIASRLLPYGLSGYLRSGKNLILGSHVARTCLRTIEMWPVNEKNYCVTFSVAFPTNPL